MSFSKSITTLDIMISGVCSAWLLSELYKDKYKVILVYYKKDVGYYRADYQVKASFSIRDRTDLEKWLIKLHKDEATFGLVVSHKPRWNMFYRSVNFEFSDDKNEVSLVESDNISLTVKKDNMEKTES